MNTDTNCSPPLTPRAKKILALAQQCARKGNQDYVCPAHILIGMYQVLGDVGIGATLSKLSSEQLESLMSNINKTLQLP